MEEKLSYYEKNISKWKKGGKYYNKQSYYQQNKHKYRKGGKYYNYVPKGERELKKLEVKRGSFLISFD